MEMIHKNTDTINIYCMKKYIKVRFTHADTLFQSYSIFIPQCRSYGIYISDISQITHKESSMCTEQVNRRNNEKERRD